MNNPDRLHRQSHRLLQAGTTLFLLGLLIGIAVPAFAVPRLALSAHLLAITQSVFVIALGLMWSRLRFSRAVARAGFTLAIYGCLAALGANLLGAMWGAGNSLLPIAAGAARGTPSQELAIVVLLRTGGAALVATTLTVLWGLRGGASRAIGD